MFKIVIFDPTNNKEYSIDNDVVINKHSAYLTTIHNKENALLSDLLPREEYTGEDEITGEPVMKPIIIESPEDIANELLLNKSIMAKHAFELMDLQVAQKEINQQSIIRGNNNNDNENENVNYISFRLPLETLNWFGDAASIDLYFLKQLKHNLIPASRNVYGAYNGLEYETKCIMLLCSNNDIEVDYSYFGHVWYFTHPDFPDLCAIYGMKSSLVNIIARENGSQAAYRKGIAKRIILDGLIPFATSVKENRKKIIVPWPLPPMIPILLSLGFKEYNDIVNDEEIDDDRDIDNPRIMKFLRPYTMTSNYYILNVKID